MMKGKLRQLISILLISVLVLSMAAPGFAEETTGTTETATTKVTINSRTSGHTFELYQIFSGDIDTNDKGESVLTNIDWGESVKTDELIEALEDTASDASSNLYNTFKDIKTGLWTAAMADDATDSDKKALAYAVARALSAVSDNTEQAYAFADLVCTCDKNGDYLYLSDSAASTSTVKLNDRNPDVFSEGYLYYYEMSDLASGYYVLMDAKDSLGYTSDNQILDTASYTRYILGMIDGEVTVNAKADNPTIDKYIVDPDSNENAEESDENLEKTEEYSIGDDIIYQLNSNVPDMEGYTSYWFMAEDMLCPGLDFINMKSVTVGGNDVPLAKTVKRTFDESDSDYSDPLTEEFYKGSVLEDNLKSSEDDITVDAGTYTLYWYEFYDTNDVKTETKLYIVLNGFYESYKDNVGAEILITYTVRLNENASIGEYGNDNTVDLIYSNNPNDTYDGEPTPDTENNPTGGIGKTTTKKTVSYTSLIKLKKIDVEDKTKVLEGATFKLTGISSGTTTYYILETSDEFEYVENREGELVDANEFEETEVKDWKDYEESLHSEYTRWTTVPTDSTYTVTTQKVDNNVELPELSGTTGSDGYVIFEGLGEGIYKIEETSAPYGYNKLNEYIYIKIEYTDPSGFEGATKTWADQPDTGDAAGWSFKYIISGKDPEDADWEDAEIYTECNMDDGLAIENTSGVLLPSTGGMGTMVFTVAGLCAMAGAVIFLYTKRRREEQ